MYYNYHAKIKKLISAGELKGAKIFDEWNKISPALVLFFASHPPMPVRIHKWQEYILMLEKLNIIIEDKRNLINSCANNKKN